MTNHSYFNLNGDPTKPINNHLIYVNADNYTPVDATYMPVGKIESVKGLAFDCTSEAEIGERITNNDAAHQQIKFGNGFDHNWCLNTYKAGDEAASLSQVAASIYSPETGIKLEVYTNEPGIQVYSGNFLDGSATGKKGIVYNQHAGICLETQKYPNSPNVKAWPSPYLNPGETYHSVCKFAFSVK
jgi:aldose 1-epimerase